MGQVSDEKPETRTADNMWRESDTFRRFLFESPIGEAAATVSRSQSARLFEDLMIYQESWARPKTGVAPGRTGLARRRPPTVERLVQPRRRHRRHRRDAIRGRLAPWPDVRPRVLQEPRRAGGRDRGAVLDRRPASRRQRRPRSVPCADHRSGARRRDHLPPACAPHRVRSVTAHPRRTFTIRFMGDDIRWAPKGTFYHPWMRDNGLQEGDKPDHPRFPIIWQA